MSHLPPDEDCSPCCGPEVPCVIAEPGPVGRDGPPGDDGDDGTDGSNAYTFLAASFVQPAASGSVVVVVVDGLWASVGQIVYASTGGYYEVVARSATTITLENLNLTGNAAPGATIAIGQQISPAGLQGEDGTLGGAAGGVLTGNYPNPGMAASGVSAGVFTKVTVTVDGRVTVGDTLDAADIPDIDAATQLTGILAIANGGTGASAALGAFNNLSPTTTKGDLIVDDGTNDTRLAVGSNGQSVVADSVETKGVKYQDGYILLGRATCNANTTGDTAIAIICSKYIVRKIIAHDASINLTTVTGGIYTAAAKGGSAIVAAAQSYVALTASTKFLDLTLQAPATTDFQTSSSLFFSPTSAQGSAATVVVDVWGEKLS